MKPIVKKRHTVILAGVCLLLQVLSASGLAAVDLGYRRQDKESDHQRYLARLSLDKGKVEKAIETTRKLIDRSTNRPYLPELYLRLAELFIEKSRIVYFIRKDQVQDKASSLDQLESNSLKNQAIEIYQRIITHFPDFPDRDKVYFFMAHEFRELGQFDQMIASYRAIIKKHPQSGYVPECYLLLGDYFIGKEDLDTARRHYEAVLKYPGSPALSIARYKLAWCHINKAEFTDAIRLFEQAVVDTAAKSKTDVDTYKRVDIRLESLVDMAFCYGECYKKNTPGQALAYFRKYAWSRQVYMTVLEKLAYRYFLKKKWHHAAVVYRELSRLQHNAEKLLEYSKNIFECVQAQGSFTDTDQDIRLIVKALKKQKYAVHIPEKQKKTSLHDYELYARDLVTHAHEKARKEKSVAGFRRAADAYKQYLDFFESSPVYLEMAGNYAETLFASKQYFEAGKQYERIIARISENSSKREEALYSSVISYYSALKNRDDLNYYQIAYARGGLTATGKAYAAAYPKSRHVPDVLFNVAWIAYDAGKYEAAIQEFSSFVDRYPHGKPARAAIHLILDAYHLKEDYENLIRYGRKILAKKEIRDKSLRKEIARIVGETESRMVSSLTLAAMDDWEGGKNDLIDFARKSGSSTMGAEALNALIVSSKEKGDLETLYSAGEELIRKYPRSPKVAATLGVMIDTALKSGRYRLVADYLESFADQLPQHANTRDFLQQAGWIRKNLGQYEKSNTDFRRLLGLGVKDSKKREEIIFAMADNAVRTGAPAKAIANLTRYKSQLGKVGKVRARAQIADLYLQTGKPKKALQYRKVAYRGYSPKIGQTDPALRADMAKMVYNKIHQKNKAYMTLQLGHTLDNRVAARKAELLAELEKGYQAVMGYQSPDWALTACYRSYEINREFARFLEQSPLPKLTDQEKKQYKALIQQKAASYRKKADQYLQTCMELAHKWEVCDPGLVQFYKGGAAVSGSAADLHGFSGKGSDVSIVARKITDAQLKVLHQKLIQSPDNPELLLALSEMYIRKGDFRKSLLIGQKAATDLKSRKGSLAARLYNDLGMANLYIGNDREAKEAFEKALFLDAGSAGARINLAGLLFYYGHTDQAVRLYADLPGAETINQLDDMIHPRAREYYYVQNHSTKS